LLKLGLYVAPSVLLLNLPWLTFTSQAVRIRQRVTVRQRVQQQVQAEVIEAVRINLLVDTSVSVQVGDTVQIRADVNPQ
jgi:hypothetical protein